MNDKYQNIVKAVAEQYVKEISDKLRDYEYNEDLMKLYVMGGGAKTVSYTHLSCVAVTLKLSMISRVSDFRERRKRLCL